MQKTETICDDNGVQIAVTYTVEKSPPHFEECHGRHNVGSLTETTIQGVSLVIGGHAVDVKPLLTHDQFEFIHSKLNP